MTSVRSRTGSEAELNALIRLFYPDPAQVARFEAVRAAGMPAPYRRLLHHEHHMTVTVERFYGEPVNVHVVESHEDGRRYWRQILLARQSDDYVVQFGIVRLELSCLDSPVRRAIEARAAPLGRILIEHHVMREVQLLAVWRVNMGPALKRLMPARVADVTYGRTALIHCNGEPAVELLEIVAPVDISGDQK
jgi:chorismate-pyruvate lyase